MQKPEMTLLLMLALAAPCPMAQAQSVPLEKCQALKEKIERYTSLRRHGGSAARMNALKRSRDKSEEAFNRYECRRYGRELK